MADEKAMRRSGHCERIKASRTKDADIVAHHGWDWALGKLPLVFGALFAAMLAVILIGG